MNTKKIFKIIGKACGAIGLMTTIWSCSTFGPLVKSANSVKQINDHFYYMEYSGDYQLERFLDQGGAETNKELGTYIEQVLRGKKVKKVFKEEVPLNTGCAAISSVTPEGKKIFGRNYDWGNLKSAVIIRTNPTKGYKSICTTQLDFIGFGENYKPDTFGHRYLAAAGIFVPLDGMNEKGLCISDLMAGDTEATDQKNADSNVTTTLAIRAILDYCADVPEAIEFLENHNMHSVIGYAHHFAISDKTGRMVVVEYVDNKMIVTEADAVTNHYLGAEKDLSDRQDSVYRLGVLNQRLEEKGNLTEEEMKEALYDIRAGRNGNENDKTWWRCIFNQDDLSVTYTLEENYESSAELNFKL